MVSVLAQVILVGPALDYYHEMKSGILYSGWRGCAVELAYLQASDQFDVGSSLLTHFWFL